MAEKDHESRNLASGKLKTAPEPASKVPNSEQLLTRSTDDLIRQLKSPEMSNPANAPLRRLIIGILQERKGNAFVQNLLGEKIHVK